MNAKTLMALPSIDEIDYDQFITEDDTPVDIFSDQQQRLLISPLYSYWNHPEPFLAAANVGLYYHPDSPALVPDMMLSLGVRLPRAGRNKKYKVYFTWVAGKPPDVVVEVVSNKEGEETGRKLQLYAEIGIRYYIVFDPDREILDTDLHVYELQNGRYERKPPLRNASGSKQEVYWLEEAGLGLTLWEGEHEQDHELWLRWCDREGVLIPIAVDQRLRAEREHEIAEIERNRAERERQNAELERHRAERERQNAEREKHRAEQEQERAELEKNRAEQEREKAEIERSRAEQEREKAEIERSRAERERERAEKLMAKLKALGIDPDIV